MSGWPCPRRGGLHPDSTKLLRAFANRATCVSSKETPICRPSPAASRWRGNARMPMVTYTPVIISAIYLQYRRPLSWGSLPTPSRTHPSVHALTKEVSSRQVSIRPRLAKARDPALHQSRKAISQLIVRRSRLCAPSCLIVLHEQICTIYQPQD